MKTQTVEQKVREHLRGHTIEVYFHGEIEEFVAIYRGGPGTGCGDDPDVAVRNLISDIQDNWEELNEELEVYRNHE